VVICFGIFIFDSPPSHKFTGYLDWRKRTFLL